MTIERTYRRMNKALRLAHSGEADRVLAAAQEILATSMKHGEPLGSPGAVRDYLRLLLQNREYEVFVVVLLDAQNRVIATEEMFRGTLTQTSVYPREVVKGALRYNAAAVTPGAAPLPVGCYPPYAPFVSAPMEVFIDDLKCQRPLLRRCCTSR